MDLAFWAYQHPKSNDINEARSKWEWWNLIQIIINIIHLIKWIWLLKPINILNPMILSNSSPIVPKSEPHINNHQSHKITK